MTICVCKIQHTLPQNEQDNLHPCIYKKFQTILFIDLLTEVGVHLISYEPPA